MRFIQELRSHLQCEVRDDAATRAIYAIDASILEIEPLAVCIPRTKEDLITAITIAHQFQVPVIPRGAATGISGGCIGQGLVIDTSRYLRRILSIDPKNKRAVVEPGVIQDELNQACLPYGLRLGPDTSTGNRATIGGMVASNAAGAHSLHYGRMCDHVQEVELILVAGDVIRTKMLTQQQLEQKCLLQNAEGHIYRELDQIRRNHTSDIRREFPHIKRRASGYNLDTLIDPDRCNISQLIVGSQGTLGFISEITLQLSEILPVTTLVLVSARDMIAGMQRLPSADELRPYALEMIDRKIIEAGKISPALQGKVDFLHADTDALFVYEFASSDLSKIHECVTRCKKDDTVIAVDVITERTKQEHVWALRKAGLGLLLSQRSYSRAIAFIEDIAVPADKVAPFTKQLIALFQKHKKEAGIYGHIGDGCLHIRPYIDLQKSDEIDTMRKLMDEVSTLVQHFHGVLSAEHGDGLIRSYLNKKMFGDRLFSLFCQIKKAFDPHFLMNPGKIVTEENAFSYLKLSPQKPIHAIATFLDFSSAGGFELAADMCNGNGQCRKKEGLMCPSYQATLNEKDTTRARAQTLRALIHGRITKEEMLTKPFYDVFDLCVQCKGCKTECPSQVDMAKMKSEYLFWYHTKHGYPLRSYLFGNVGKWLKMASYLPRIANGILFLLKPFAPLLGITNKRKMPKIAHFRFSKVAHTAPDDATVVLFSDTFTEFTRPDLGLKAKRVLEAAGYSVAVPEWSCCGRTHFSKGLLTQAKMHAHKLLDILYPYAAKGLYITTLEPSCLATLQDEWHSLHLDPDKVACVHTMCRTLEELLLISPHPLKAKLKKPSGTIYVHTHCHEKSAGKGSRSIEIMKQLFDSTVKEVSQGCCGMAGSFGYEHEHYVLSQEISHKTIAPSLKKIQPGDICIANGVSCREQIDSIQDVHPIHCVELLDSLLI